MNIIDFDARFTEVLNKWIEKTATASAVRRIWRTRCPMCTCAG